MIKKLIIFIIIVAAFVGTLVYLEQGRESPYDAEAFFSNLELRDSFKHPHSQTSQTALM